jgi:uncharacterized membrane protein YobD (UPF0266 family)
VFANKREEKIIDVFESMVKMEFWKSLIFFKIYLFYILISKIIFKKYKKYYFNIFINKKYLKTQYQPYSLTGYNYKEEN